METQLAATRKMLPMALLALAFVLIIIFGWRSFGGPLPLQAAGYRVEIPVAEALNMEAGADVTIAGVHVGEISELRRDGFQPIAMVELEPRYAPLHVGARAIPRTKSLLGEAYLEITPGGSGAPAIREGSRLPTSSVDRAQAIDDVLETFSPAARADLRRLARGMSSALDGRAGDLNATLGTAPLFTGGVAQVMDQLDQQRGDLTRLVSNSGDVFAALGEREGALRAAIRAGDDVLGTTARSEQALRATVRSLPPFLEDLTDAADQLGAASGDLRAASEALAPVTPKLLPTLLDLRDTAPVFRTTVNRLPSVMVAARRGLPAVEQILQSFGQSSGPMYAALREIVPVLQLAREVRRSLVAFFANIGQILNGVVPKPDGTTGHVISAMPSFWNETLGGWVKRLPSNRPNPYPKPNSALDIARGGLKSFDCRQTGNRQYVPPTGGNGAPPCILQGPWEFNGRSAFYPRLRRAAP
jgi:virulence factor Mce-like protein